MKIVIGCRKQCSVQTFVRDQLLVIWMTSYSPTETQVEEAFGGMMEIWEENGGKGRKSAG